MNKRIERIYRGGDSCECGCNASIEHEGKWYCKMHDPSKYKGVPERVIWIVGHSLYSRGVVFSLRVVKETKTTFLIHEGDHAANSHSCTLHKDASWFATKAEALTSAVYKARKTVERTYSEYEKATEALRYAELLLSEELSLKALGETTK